MSFELTGRPKYVTTAGFGCIFNNYGFGPGTPEEPTIITKFFGVNGYEGRNANLSKSYDEEKQSHQKVKDRCGNKTNTFATMNSIFGIDLHPHFTMQVKGYKDPIYVKGPDGKVIKQELTTEYQDVSPTMICETPNAKGAALHTPVYKIKNSDGSITYPVIKMNNLGHDLFETPQDLDVKSFIQMMELMVVFHTGMIHNDMKGNNMLVSPLSRRVSLIDFGLSSEFNSLSPTMPYFKRSYPHLKQVWYAYPPEFAFVRSNAKEYREPLATNDPYVEEILDVYDQIKLQVQWPHNPVFELNAGESMDDRHQRVSRILNKIHKDYFSKGHGPQIYLETAITADMYAVGLELPFNYGLKKRNDKMGVSSKLATTKIKIGTSEIKGDEFILRMNLLLTALHPKFRPYHINVIKLFNHFNPAFMTGAKTLIRVANEYEPYCQITILNGKPSEIRVDSGMALGSLNCPITKDDVMNNLKVFYFMLQGERSDIIYLMNAGITYDEVLSQANNFIKEIPTSLFKSKEPTAASAAPPSRMADKLIFEINIQI